MPNSIRTQEVYLGGYTPETFNVANTPVAPAVSGLYLPGQLGLSFNRNNRTYTIVQLDTSATTPAAGQLLYWRDKTNFIVTNVVARALCGATTHGWRNEIAGICMLAATAGYYICMLIQGTDIPVACLATNAVGDIAISDLSANVGNALNIAAGSAITYRTVGVFKSISSGNKANVDVAIPSLD